MLTFKEKIHLTVLRDIEARDYEKFLSLSNFIEDAFETQQKEIEKEVDVLLKEAKNEEDEAMLVDFFSEDISLFKDDFPNLQRNALMVSLISLVEANMIRLCQSYGRLFSTNEVFDSSKIGVINRGIKYIQDYLGLQNSRLDKSISLVRNLVLIRNAIVHSQGSLKNRDSANTIKKFIKNKKYLGIDRRDRIILKKGSIQYYTKEMHKFNVSLHQTLSDGFRKIK